MCLLQTKSAWSVREAPLPPLEVSIVFYYKLFTGMPADMAEALTWDQTNALEKRDIFYAWEDTHTQHYIVHDDGKQPWTFPQEQPRVKQEKKAGKSVKRKETKTKTGISYRGYNISSAKKNIKLANDKRDRDLTVLGVVERNANKKYLGLSLKLVAGLTAFRVLLLPLVCMCIRT